MGLGVTGYKFRRPNLKPFFSFYGGKWRVAPHYPAPLYDTIVEPFAGSAGYAVRYSAADIHLYEIDPVIASVWDYLIHVSEGEIRALPIEVSHIDTLSVVAEAKYLIGFWLNKGTSRPSKSPSKWMRSNLRPNSYWGKTIRERIASQLQYIRHWRVTQGTYALADEEKVTWFIDPPYILRGGGYKYHTVDYTYLAHWCRQRGGQVIVCEQEGAIWLPFESFRTIKATPGSHGRSISREVIYIQ